ncbi:DUF4354 family protein [Serratia marcescens]|uniref:DUF4354 family protein n=1 Tax=Serratia marcescens TaxID=615 RepID=UPI001EF091B8|nr:DUF4354 family protein [Serratia marcescens]ULH09885.1 DUF4354 family protein [Serratia marcescens]
MKIKQLLAAIVLSTTTFIASASVGDSIKLDAKQGSQGVMNIAGKTVYTQRFDIILTNQGNKAVDLRKVCLTAYTPKGKKFALDTVNEELIEGVLKPRASVKGFAVFTAYDASVYKATKVKIVDNCK